ncbi:DNA-binding transcriptional MerR regulator [Nocardiopsis mwathae]|uniref:DNA-binding transcriptional MerR regulator n=1 Tax=Nocardiopsis mwathae TaxID=1472723 RepID=A0A7X0D869_9ACTN|nr:MerR family transcriptional regulator [Nocardiopsis mwathae]MBB6174456.1 DNA-binding transcriptional MerR regulator [Nocardiopsis mwathae]
MMSIGEFTRLTTLSAKALRLYDERGLLRPASVDAWSGYRRYTAAQLPAALRLRALRDAGIPLAHADHVLGDAETAREALAGHRARLAAERARQDAALALLEDMVRGEGHSSRDVEVRRAPAQPWAGVVLELPDEDDGVGRDAGGGGGEDAEIAWCNDAFAALWTGLADEGIAPTGAYWTSYRVVPGTDRVEMLCCWPLARPLPEGWSPPGRTVAAGVLAERSEYVARWRPDAAAPEIQGAVHPAVLALVMAAEQRGEELDWSRLRQLGLLDEHGRPIGTEIAVPTA